MGVSINQHARSRAQLQIPKYELITSGGDPIHGHNFSIFMNYICHVAELKRSLQPFESLKSFTL